MAPTLRSKIPTDIRTLMPVGLHKLIQYEARLAGAKTSQRYEDRIKNGACIYIKFNIEKENMNPDAASAYYSIISHGFSDIAGQRGQAQHIDFEGGGHSLSKDADMREIQRKGLIAKAAKTRVTISVDRAVKQWVNEVAEYSKDTVTYTIIRFLQASIMADYFRRQHHFEGLRRPTVQEFERVVDETDRLTLHFYENDGQPVAAMPYVIEKKTIGVMPEALTYE